MNRGAIIRGDSTRKRMAIVFTGDEFAEGVPSISNALKQAGVKASFFFTGRFYRNPGFRNQVQRLRGGGHYLGAHSDQHLLYCDWNRRDSLLVTKTTFRNDLRENYKAMARFGIRKQDAPYFLPPYEWYNDSVSAWTRELGLQLVNYTPGTLSHADYTSPADKNYRSSDAIFQSILGHETRHGSGMNGFILLLHAGVGPHRTDKFYDRLPELLAWLKQRGYRLVRVDELLNR